MGGYSTKMEVALWIQTTTQSDVKFAYWDIDNPNQVFQTLNPMLKRFDDSASLVLDHLINDDYRMFVTYAWIDQEYKHSQSLNGGAATRDQRMGPIQGNIFGTQRNFTTTETADESESNYVTKQFEIRISKSILYF